MAFDDGLDDDESVFRPPLPPDDRLWRHPSEVSVADAPRPPTRPWGLALASGLAGALLATGLAAAAGGFDDGGSDPEPAASAVERVVEPPVKATAGESGPTDSEWAVAVAEQVRPAIVQVRVDQGDGMATGSGVIFRDDGHVLTNDHVVAEADEVAVILSDGREVGAELKGGDPDTDVAVLKLAGGPYPSAPLGSAEAVKAGQLAVAIGSPLGLDGGPSVSVGVISAVGRTVDRPGPGRDLLDMIQTDATIAPGSSGGALLDRRGAVIGVTTAIAVTGEGSPSLGFATPIDIARLVADDLIATGKATHVWLGIEGADVDQATADRLGLPGGARVRRVVGGSPADEAGLEAGDVILTIDGRAVTSMTALVVALRPRKVGTEVGLEYLRGTDRRRCAPVLEERPAEIP